jgi:hypothetical protein
MAYNVLLPDGRNVNIRTQEGADIFIGGPDFEGFSSNMEDVNRIQQKQNLSNQDKGRLEAHYVMVDVLAQHASPNVFKQIPKSELKSWWDHTIVVIQKLTTSGRWTRTGSLEEHDAFCLNACVPMLTHPQNCLLAFESIFFAVLAAFVQAVQSSPSKMTLPCADVSETVCMICSNARFTLVGPSSSTPWGGDKIFKKYEASGILVQFIRCSTVPQPREASGLIKTYEDLLQCNVLLKKKFKKGEPCGDVVHAILKQKDGHPAKTKRIVTFLTSIAKLAGTLQTDINMVRTMCRHCAKHSSGKLMACAKCHQAFYCSRKCQKDDWKKHKPLCGIATSKEKKRTDAISQTSIVNFAQANYMDIVEDILECCLETGLKKEELVLQVDFLPGKDGTIPALRDPPDYLVKDARGYFEGSRPNEPDWFYKSTGDVALYKNHLDPLLAALKDHFERMTTNHVLCMCRCPDGNSVYRLQLQAPKTMNHMFSEKALDAYRIASEDQNFGPLSRIFDEPQVQFMKHRLKWHAPTTSAPPGMPSGDDLDGVRMMLNNRFGADFDLDGGRR